jgi:PAS domain S-box-containing protein
MVFEVRYFSQFSFHVYTTRLVATVTAFIILVLLYTETGMKRPVLMVHLLLLVIIISSGYMIFLMPKTLIVNSHIVGLMIFTSALFLSWEVKNQIVVAIYYNIVFASAILLNDGSIYFLPNMYESVLFVLFLSLISVVGSAVNFKLRMQLAENSFRVNLSEKKFRSIFDNSLEGIFQSSPEGRFLTVNAAFAQILGYSIEELLKLNIAHDVYKNEADRGALIAELSIKKEVTDYQLTLKKKDGSEVIIRLNARFVSDSEGKSIYFEGSIQDITSEVIAEMKKQKAEQDLRDEKMRSDMLAREALKSNLIKSQFLANMSHEIRTPMNGIIGYLSLIQKAAYKSEDELKQFASNARKSAESLLTIINDILDLSKIESGKMELGNIDFNLLDVIDESVSMLSAKIKEKNLTISRIIEENTLNLLNGDSTRIRQVFVNLIGNAIKFTHKGGIKIFVKTINTDKDIVTIFCSVEDTGIGIPADKINTLFKPFSQVDGSHTRKYGGTGLGLVICKEFVTMMGGEIGVQSDIDKGSRFFFTLKLKPQIVIAGGQSHNSLSRVYELKNEIKENIPESKEIKEVRGEHKILLAEDNFINQKVCLRILHEAGFTSDAVTNGLEAIDAVKKNIYSLVLMDVQMPECDGFTATAEIRKLGGSFIKLPIIAITAHALLGDKEKCLEAGMNDYISKPIVSENLIKMIDEWVKINTNIERVPLKSPSPRVNEIFDFTHLDKISMENVEFQKDLISTFIEDLDKRFDKLQTHLESKNQVKLINEAHTIKGAALSVGALAVGRNALEVEMTGKQNDFSALPAKLSELKESIEKTKSILIEHFGQEIIISS